MFRNSVNLILYGNGSDLKMYHMYLKKIELPFLVNHRRPI